MNNRLPPRTYPRTVRWLAVAGAVIGLSAPLAANADHRDNDAIEVLASAAIAYVVIDAAGGFKDGHKHRRQHGHHDHHSGCGHHGWGHRDDGHHGYGHYRHHRGWAPYPGHYPAPPRHGQHYWSDRGHGYGDKHGRRGKHDRHWEDRGRGNRQDRDYDHEYRYRQRAYH